jgi:hypothetical protein
METVFFGRETHATAVQEPNLRSVERVVRWQLHHGDLASALGRRISCIRDALSGIAHGAALEQAIARELCSVRPRGPAIVFAREAV